MILVEIWLKYHLIFRGKMSNLFLSLAPLSLRDFISTRFYRRQKYSSQPHQIRDTFYACKFFGCFNSVIRNDGILFMHTFLLHNKFINGILWMDHSFWFANHSIICDFATSHINSVLENIQKQCLDVFSIDIYFEIKIICGRDQQNLFNSINSMQNIFGQDTETFIVQFLIRREKWTK